GHFAPELGGHFELESGAHFKLELGGQYHWNLQTPEENKKISRQKLYDLVWSKPMTELAKEYNISDNGLRKICKKLDIPLPQLGHWQKLQYGKKVKTIPLPKDFKGEETITLNERKEEKDNENNVISEYHKLLKQITADTSLSFDVPDRLSNPDKLISEAKENFTTVAKEKYGIYRGITTTSNGILSISVAPKNCSRALRIMDKMIKLLKQRGHNVIVKENTTYAVVKGEQIKIRLKEKIKRVITKDEKYSWNNTDYVPTGILSFKIDEYPEKEFNDTINLTLEEQLPKILTKLELVSEQLKKRREDIENRQREYRIIKEAEEAIKKRKSTEIENFKKLLDESERCKKAVDMRNYIKQIENNAIKDNNLSEKLTNWINWANNKADWYDPITRKEDELLNENNINDILNPKQPNSYYR
ncbi:hypothetical protein, partial [Flavobacterium urumqiense]